MTSITDYPVVRSLSDLLTREPGSRRGGACARRNPKGGCSGALSAEQALDLGTAIKIYTRNPARAIGLGHINGMIEAGKKVFPFRPASSNGHGRPMAMFDRLWICPLGRDGTAVGFDVDIDLLASIEREIPSIDAVDDLEYARVDALCAEPR